MSWTAPRTWVAGEVVRSNLLNANIAANLREVDPTPEWIEVTSFANGWINYGGEYQVARYRKQSGWVYVQGLVKNGTAPGNIFQLPPGYRPNAQQIFPSVENNAYGRVDLYADGWISTVMTTSVFTSLSHIIFRAQQ